MARKNTSGEALLISTMLNTGVDPAIYGISDGMLAAYQTQYRWLVSYPGQYGTLPTSSVFRHAFPDFVLDGDAEDIIYAAEVVRGEHRRREAIKLLTTVSEHINTGDVEEAIQLIQSAKFTTSTRAQVSNALEDDDFFVEYSEKPDAMTVPWKTLQKETGGIRKGDLWYIAARQGNGKSWTLGDMARHALIEGREVKFYSLEMPKHQVMVRMHVLLGASLDFNVNHIAMRDRVYDPVAYKRLVKKIKSEVMGKFYVQDSSFGKISPQVIAQDTDMDVVFVDYVGLMTSPTGSAAVEDWRHMAAISNALKLTANSNQVRVVAAAQINREGDTLGLHTPRLKNLSQSDALGQDGDVVVTAKQSGQAMAYSLEKNRHGEGGKKFYTKFLPNIGKFPEITQEEAQMIADETAP
jgi:replicative DNA helicase